MSNSSNFWEEITDIISLGVFEEDESDDNSEKETKAIATIITFKEGRTLYYVAREKDKMQLKAVENAFKNAKKQNLRIIKFKVNMVCPNLFDKACYIFNSKPQKPEGRKVTKVKILDHSGYTAEEVTKFNLHKESEFKSSAALSTLKFLLGQAGVSDINIVKLAAKVFFKATTAGKIAKILDVYNICRNVNSNRKLMKKEKGLRDKAARMMLDGVFFLPPDQAASYFEQFELYSKAEPIKNYNLEKAIETMHLTIWSRPGFDKLELNSFGELCMKFGGKTVKFILNEVSILLILA